MFGSVQAGGRRDEHLCSFSFECLLTPFNTHRRFRHTFRRVLDPQPGRRGRVLPDRPLDRIRPRHPDPERGCKHRCRRAVLVPFRARIAGLCPPRSPQESEDGERRGRAGGPGSPFLAVRF